MCRTAFQRQRAYIFTHLHGVDHPIIPTHHWSEHTRIPTRVERIVPGAKAVSNDVHRHDFHELFFFAKGTGEHMIDLEQVTINVPCVHLVAPGQVHKLDRSADMQGLVVMFAQDAQLGQGNGARAELFAHAGRPSAFSLTAEQLDESSVLVRLMETELKRSSGPVNDVVEGILGILCIKCAHWAKAEGERGLPNTYPTDVVDRFMDLVECGFLNERQVGKYAAQLAITADHLNAQVKKRLDRTASSVIQGRLLLEAKRLLLHADLSIKEVGYALNMKDPAYFTRWFHRVEGDTPAAFRTRIRDKYKP